MYHLITNKYDGSIISISAQFIEPTFDQNAHQVDGDISELGGIVWSIRATPSVILSKKGFIDRLTPEELIAIYALADTDMAVRVWLEKFKVSNEIRLDDPELVSTLPLFELTTPPVLSPGRASEILSL